MKSSIRSLIEPKMRIKHGRGPDKETSKRGEGKSGRPAIPDEFTGSFPKVRIRLTPEDVFARRDVLSDLADE